MSLYLAVCQKNLSVLDRIRMLKPIQRDSESKLIASKFEDRPSSNLNIKEPVLKVPVIKLVSYMIFYPKISWESILTMMLFRAYARILKFNF